MAGRAARTAFALAITVAFTACGELGLSEGPSTTCSESGTQCLLPDGPLGVCEPVRCPPTETGACFQCTPQH